MDTDWEQPSSVYIICSRTWLPSYVWVSRCLQSWARDVGVYTSSNSVFDFPVWDQRYPQRSHLQRKRHRKTEQGRPIIRKPLFHKTDNIKRLRHDRSPAYLMQHCFPSRRSHTRFFSRPIHVTDKIGVLQPHKRWHPRTIHQRFRRTWANPHEIRRPRQPSKYQFWRQMSLCSVCERPSRTHYRAGRQKTIPAPVVKEKCADANMFHL